MNVLEYLLFMILLFGIDMVWVMQPFHKVIYENIQKSLLHADPLAGILFYLIAPLGYFFFIRGKMNPWYGFLMGFLMYATYDLTNKTVFKNYTWKYAIGDIIWGSILYGITSLLISFLFPYYVLNK